MSVALDKPELSEDCLKAIQRARNLFGDPIERWSDFLSVEAAPFWEQYLKGRMALALDFRIIPHPSFMQPGSDIPVEEYQSREQFFTLAILKANIVQDHKLKHWNEKLVFVDDVEIVQTPKKRVPELVGFYNFQNDPRDLRANLLLFKSTVQGGFKAIPRPANWESGPIGSSSLRYHAVVRDIESTTQIVESVAENQCGIYKRNLGMVVLDCKTIFSGLAVFIDDQVVEIRQSESSKQTIQIRDVLFGPFNFPSC